MNVLYHLTPERNVPSIQSTGLLINRINCIGRDRARYTRIYGCSPVFLTEDPYLLSFEQLTRTWIEKYRPVVLTVITTGLVLHDEYNHVETYDGGGYTWVCLYDIEPERIVGIERLENVPFDKTWYGV